jgi:hypothetical protein
VRKGERGEDVRCVTCVRVTVIGETIDGNITCDDALGGDTRLEVLNETLRGLEMNEDCVGGGD